MAVKADRLSSVRALRRYALAGEHHRHWYTDGVPVVEAVADSLGVQPETLAEVIAITSPRVSVSRNMALALRYLNDRERYASAPGEVLRRDLGVIQATASALQHWERTGKIRGPKTSAFARALLGDPDALVIDVWMSRALGVPQDRVTTLANRKKIAERIGAVARSLGWTIAETQAAIWAGVIPTWTDSRGRRKYLDAPPLAETLSLAAK